MHVPYCWVGSIPPFASVGRATVVWNSSVGQFRYNIRKHLLIYPSRWERIDACIIDLGRIVTANGFGILTSPLQDLLIVLVISTKQCDRRVMSQTLDVVYGFASDVVDKTIIGWINATGKLEVLPDQNAKLCAGLSIMGQQIIKAPQPSQIS